jgi:hypothetical protein
LNQGITAAMSFNNFDPSQGQNNQFTADTNGPAGPTQQLQQQQMPMMQQQPGMPQQQPGQNSEMQQSFQGQGIEQGSAGQAPGGDSKTTLWYVTTSFIIPSRFT